ncbi:hypothetical protein CAMGR0001_1241 [Campylobacter gracilis RM3268]|uniref:Uncharacterized protein n=1 Tax=Campylobacter gracilis RM3268 TaxID=553220 RepID=C8PJ42_9BACT|nr:hypothetical protein CAMGR0001_1241 [Campylobacter gracilis RM3268]
MLKLSYRASSKLNRFIEAHAWLCDSGAFAWFCLRRRIPPARLVCGLSYPLWRNFALCLWAKF